MTKFPRRSQLSPIQFLPIELLSYIFVVTTLEDDEDGNPSFTTESIRLPHILSSVSRKWRLIAQCTPALWTNICVTSELIDTRDADQLQASTFDTRHLDVCLKHSRNYPLDILIDARDYHWDFSEPGYFIFFSEVQAAVAHTSSESPLNTDRAT